MRILKALSALLCYPTAELIDALPEVQEWIERDRDLGQESQSGLSVLARDLCLTALIESQQRYVELFDRGRALSLHLFEHVHGESRDRGQAMVDLVDLYEAHGFELAARELPDYLPLLLEFLSLIPPQEARDQLRNASPVLGLIGARLHERRSSYRAIFDALGDLAGSSLDEVVAIHRAVATEPPDDALLHMDEIWAEEAISFLNPGTGCGSRRTDERPIQLDAVTTHRCVPKA
jgi:nitrate reductase delta subunit